MHRPKPTHSLAALIASHIVIDLIDKSLRPSFKIRIRLSLRRYKQLIKRVLKKLIGGGGNNNLVHQTLPCSQISQSDFVPSMPQDTKISAITFRNKQNGWKSYRMEITLKWPQTYPMITIRTKIPYLAITFKEVLNVDTILNLKEGLGMMGMCFNGKPLYA